MRKDRPATMKCSTDSPSAAAARAKPSSVSRSSPPSSGASGSPVGTAPNGATTAQSGRASTTVGHPVPSRSMSWIGSSTNRSSMSVNFSIPG